MAGPLAREQRIREGTDRSKPPNPFFPESVVLITAVSPSAAKMAVSCPGYSFGASFQLFVSWHTLQESSILASLLLRQARFVKILCPVSRTSLFDVPAGMLGLRIFIFNHFFAHDVAIELASSNTNLKVRAGLGTHPRANIAGILQG
jgi:hypothetical protein